MRKVYAGRTYEYQGRPGPHLRPGDRVVARRATGVWRRVLVWPVDVERPTSVAGIACRVVDLDEV